MTGTECVQLVAFIRARSPQTFLAEGTPDAWFIDLQAFDLRAAQEAVVRLTRRPGGNAISLGDLLAEIRKVRNELIEKAGDPVIDVDPDDTAAWIAALRAARKRIADGEQLPCEARAIEGRSPVEQHIGSLLPAVPVDDPVRTERRALLRQAAHTRREQVEAEAAARAEHRTRVEAARAELDSLRTTP